MKLRRRFALLCALTAATVASAAQPSGVADKARVSFISAGGLRDGVYHAAIVIELAPDTTTYWRNPGEAGTPPTFDFAQSTNFANADVSMPAPTRIEEAGMDVFAYRTRVAFPVAIRPKDPAQPTRVDLKMDYAACEKICMPMHADAQLDLSPGAGPSAHAAAVADAEALVPKPIAAADAATLKPVVGASKPSWTVAPHKPQAIDLFAEAPDGYFVETKKNADGAFRLSVVEAPKGAPTPAAPVRLTMTTAQGAVEFSVRLDAAPRAP